jgi:hypothetical protein
MSIQAICLDSDVCLLHFLFLLWPRFSRRRVPLHASQQPYLWLRLDSWAAWVCLTQTMREVSGASRHRPLIFAKRYEAGALTGASVMATLMRLAGLRPFFLLRRSHQCEKLLRKARDHLYPYRHHSQPRRLTCCTRAQTGTNVLFLWLGTKGIRNCVRESHDGIFLLAYVGYIIVGLGSVSFHATLKCRSYPAGAKRSAIMSGAGN